MGAVKVVAATAAAATAATKGAAAVVVAVAATKAAASARARQAARLMSEIFQQRNWADRFEKWNYNSLHANNSCYEFILSICPL